MRRAVTAETNPFIRPDELYVWVHTWWGRDGVRDATLRSLDASDTKDRYHVHRQGKEHEKVTFFIETMRSICADPKNKWILRLEDDTIVNRFLVHNTCRWAAPHKEPHFGMGFLSVPNPVLSDKSRLGRGEVLGTPWRKNEGGMHFGGGILWKSSIFSAAMADVENCLRRHLPNLACAVCPSSVFFKKGLRSYFHVPSLVKIDLTLPRHLDGKSPGEAFYGTQPFSENYKR